MKRSQRFFVLLSALKRIGLAVSFFWLVGCSPQTVYTTNLVSVSDSFEVDERLIGRWSDVFFGKDLHIEVDKESNQLYAIWHRLPPRCKVEPIYTTRSNDQWFMNIDVHGAYYCTDPYQSPVLEDEVKDFKELYKLVKYEIRATPVEEVLAAATLALQKLAQEDQESFMGLKADLEKEIGFRLELADLETARQLFNRLITFLHSASDSMGSIELEALDIEYMSPKKIAIRLKEGHLEGRFKEKCLAEWDPDGRGSSEDCDMEFVGPLVITDTEEKIKSLMLSTGEDSLFFVPSKENQDTETENVDDPYYQLGQMLSGGWFRLKLSGPLAETRDAVREFGSE